MISRVRDEGFLGEDLVNLEFIGTLPCGETLQHDVFPVRHPGRIHDETVLEAMSAIEGRKVVHTHC